MFIVYGIYPEFEVFFSEPNFTGSLERVIWATKITEACSFEDESIPEAVIQHLAETANNISMYHVVWIDSFKKKGR